MVLKLALPFQAEGMGFSQDYFTWVPLHTERQRNALRRFARASSWFLVAFSGARVTRVLQFPIEADLRSDCQRGVRLLETLPVDPGADTRKAFDQMGDLMAQLLGPTSRFRVVGDLGDGPGQPGPEQTQ
jgi:hypothetical protein